MKNFAKRFLIFLLAAALLCPAGVWAADAPTPTLVFETGSNANSIRLSLKGLGERVIHSVQVGLVFSGS